ncbi:RagB/SusD family nutrient uptake outer membrane protein [Prolixibacteraceae bacterium JC049]|nr:RagB/SusD family nutrient uptake outer membrane protein [Prolixibacteraceae bacterium JC049]
MKINFIHKNILFPVLLFSFLGFFSCENLDEVPRDRLTGESFFKSEKDLDAAITACFKPIMGSWAGYDVRMYSMMSGDEQFTSRHGSNKERVLEFDEFGVTPNNPELINLWKVNYQSIAACNMTLARAEQVDMNADKRKKMLGQVYFMRALMYYNLVRWFGDVPLIIAPVEGEGKDILRTDKAKVYEQIIADAKMAEESLPVSWDEKGRPTQGAAKTLLASVYLTTAGWPLNETANYQKAADKAKEVINMGVYTLFDRYEKIWLQKNENIGEWIFSFQGNRNAGVGSKFGKPFLPPEESGWVDYFAEPHFFNIFPEGERKEITFHTVFTTKSGDKIPWQESLLKSPFIQKYRYGFDYTPGVNPPVDTDANLPVFRYAEVLLIYAEAQNKANGNPDDLAYKCLNDVRKRALGEDLSGYQDLAGLSTADFDKAVLAERNWELAFEAKRWYDLVRREMVEEANAHNTDRLRNSISKDRYIFPIPQREIDINPNLTQNPGY